MNDQLPAYVRTYIPIIVAAISGWLIKKGYNIDSGLLTAGVTIAAGVVYYFVSRQLEKRKPGLGILLGIPKQPAYSTEPAPSPKQGEAVVADVLPEEDLGELPGP